MALQENTTLNIVPHAADLKLEVEALIKPHLDSLDCPPFPLDELAVMAWVCCRNHVGITTEKEIFRWLLKNFKYYRNLVVEDFYARATASDSSRLKHDLDRVARNLAPPRLWHEVPMRRLHRDVAGIPSRSESACITTLAHSRRYLRRALGSELEWFPRFFELPAELRLMIYQHLFYMQHLLVFSTALFCRAGPYTMSFELFDDRHEDMTGDISDETRVWKLAKHCAYTRAPEKMLSLLLSNRQIFREAMPVFYNVNTFRVRDVEKLVQLLRWCGPFRRTQFTRIEVEQYDDASRAITKEVFDLLADIKQLQYLRITTEDGWFLKKSTTTPKNIHWVRLLCKVKVDSLHVESVGGRIASYVREERSRMGSDAEQVKTKKKASTTSRTPATKAKKASTTT